jgi:hypothetical protein
MGLLKNRLVLTFSVLFFSLFVNAQKDTIILKGQIKVGDVFYVGHSKVLYEDNFQAVVTIPTNTIIDIKFENVETQFFNDWLKVKELRERDFVIENKEDIGSSNGSSQSLIITGPVKWDNTIKVKTAFNKSENYSQIGNYLLEKGYSIENSDVSFMTVVTGPKTSLNNKYRQSALSHKLNIVCKDKEIVIRPYIQIPAGLTLELVFVQWTHKDAKGDFNYMHWFNNFKPTIEGFPNASEIEYSKQ